MRDPFPIPPIPALSKAVQPVADYLELDVLPLHVHEVVLSATFYTFVQLVVSPVLSTWLVPAIYKPLTGTKRANWDSHVVSLVQSLIINTLALWCIFTDTERANMAGDEWKERIWGYSGEASMVVSLALGYFIWDFFVTLKNLSAFGVGMLAHAVSALTVFTFGLRPFLNYYGCVFILYELSTPFLNLHWFFDKLNMTGSRPQLINGVALLVTFFSCRLCYGMYMSTWVYRDMWHAVFEGPSPAWVNNPAAANPPSVRAHAANAGPIPLWLFLLYVASNVVLNSLNVHWFFRMIAAVRKRFPADAAAPEKKNGTDKKPAVAASAHSTAIDANGGLHLRNVADVLLAADDSLLDAQ